ncbi:MAG TPA: hypothetical protein VGL39_27865 [Jatrophihabitantaceae bacterium]
MTWGRHYWPFALLAVLLIILGPEIYALATNWENSLSYWVWTQLRVQDGEPLGAHSVLWFFTLVAYLGLVGWLGPHLWLKWWRG